MKLHRYPDADLLAMDLANVLAEDLETALNHEDRALLVVPGGSTPGPIFDILCEVNLDWARVDICLSDERWVPEVHVRSNTKMIRQRLLVGRAAQANYLPLYAKSDNPETVLAELEANIVPRLPIAVLLLGMGSDMHTASLFPGTDGLEDALAPDAPVLVPMRPKSVEDVRVSFSARVLDAAVAKHLVITGAQKLAALERAQKTDPLQAPVAAILQGTDVHWAP